jgi:hypothetical protein
VPDSPKYLIVGPGRSGSSLLAAILARAGGDFGLPRPDAWDRRSGEYEHPLAHAAYKWHSRGRRAGDTWLPNRFFRAPMERRRDVLLERLCESVGFVKSSTLLWLIPPVARLGYEVRVIVSFRSFAEYSLSRYRRFGLSSDELVATYRAMYGTALLALEAHGGCLVTYDGLVDPEDDAWATPLCATTGLDRTSLLEARRDLVSTPQGQPVRSVATDFLSQQVSDIEQACLQHAPRP